MDDGLALAGIEAAPPLQAGGEVEIGEPEPGRCAELHHPVEDPERIAGDSPAAIGVDLAGEPIGAEIGVGGDVNSERLDVVAGVGDHGQVGADDLLQAGGELRAPGPAGEDDDLHAQGSPSGSPVSLRPACAL